MSPSEQTPSWRIRGRAGGCQLKSLFLRARHCSLGQHSAQTGSSAGTGDSPSGPESHTLGKKGRTGVIMVHRTGVPTGSHTEPGLFQPWACPPGEAEGVLPPESLKPLLSASGCWHTEAALIPGFGEVGRGQEDCPRLGGWTAGLIRGWLSPPTLGPCTLLGRQGPASCLDRDVPTP